MTTAIAKTEPTGSIERVLIDGDLSKLSEAERLDYYRATCESLGLNPLTQPFQYIVLNRKLTLYARKDCTDQLRKIHGVSIEKPDIQDIGGNFVVTVSAVDKFGRRDSDVGVVGKGDMGGNIGNALMKAITKAKRRVTLSICGLGMLDETEVETIPDARIVPMPAIEPEPLRLANSQHAEAFREIKKLASALAEADLTREWDRADLTDFAVFHNLPMSAAEMDADQLAELIRLLGEELEAVRAFNNRERDPAADAADLEELGF